MNDEPISLGPPRYYRAVCARHKNIFYGAYDFHAGPIIDAEAQRLKAALWKHEYGSDELHEAVSAAIEDGVPLHEIKAILGAKGSDDGN